MSLSIVLAVGCFLAQSSVEAENHEYQFQVGELQTHYQTDIAKSTLIGDPDEAGRLTLELQHKLETAALDHRQCVQQLRHGWKLSYRAGWDREREVLRNQQAVQDVAFWQHIELAKMQNDLLESQERFEKMDQEHKTELGSTPPELQMLREIIRDRQLSDEIAAKLRLDDQRDAIALAKLRHRQKQAELANTNAWNLADIDLEEVWDRYLLQGGMDAGCMAVQRAKELQEREISHRRALATTQLLSLNEQATLRLRIEQTKACMAVLAAPKAGARVSDLLKELLAARNARLLQQQNTLAREELRLKHYEEKDKLVFSYTRRMGQPCAMNARTAPMDRTVDKDHWQVADTAQAKKLVQLTYEQAVAWAKLLYSQALTAGGAGHIQQAIAAKDYDAAVKMAELTRTLELQRIDDRDHETPRPISCEACLSPSGL